MLKIYLILSVFIFTVCPALFAHTFDEEKDCNAEGCHAQLLDFEYIHDAAEDCSTCHESTGKAHPESMGNEFTLITPMPGLCFDCHDQAEEATGRMHGPASKLTPCLSCHRPHASNFSALLKNDEPDLCFGCHNKEITFDNRLIPDMAARVNEAEFVHSPVEDGCSDCHASHASRTLLLEGAFPASSYGDGTFESYGLCFDCHDSENIFSEKNSDTAFMADGQNLHFLHVVRDKSRSCINCHNVHGADHEHLLASFVMFGQWNMPVDFQDSEGGSSCLTGCHTLQTYNGD